MNDKERKIPEEVKKQISKITDEELDQVAGGNTGLIDWLSDSLKNEITAVEKPKFQQ